MAFHVRSAVVTLLSVPTCLSVLHSRTNTGPLRSAVSVWSPGSQHQHSWGLGKACRLGSQPCCSSPWAAAPTSRCQSFLRPSSSLFRGFHFTSCSLFCIKKASEEPFLLFIFLPGILSSRFGYKVFFPFCCFLQNVASQPDRCPLCSGQWRPALPNQPLSVLFQ